MFSRPHQWCVLGVLTLGLMLPGCRGSQRLARTVQVTRDPAIELPEIGAPPQRLATAKARVGSDSDTAASGSRMLDDSPHVASLASTSTTPPQTAAATPAADSPRRTLAASRAIMRKGDTQVESAPATAPTAETAKHAPAKLPADATEMLDAFKNSPPEVQQQALRQLIAAASRTADATDQPRSIDGAILESLTDIPQLPPKQANPSAEQPVRIAYATDTDASAASTPEAGLATDASAVLAASHSLSDSVAAPSEVKRLDDPSHRASAQATESADDKKLAINDAEDPETSPEGQAPHATASDGKAVGTGSLSDEQLYNELLARLSKSAADETEADRSRRLVTLHHLMVLAGRPDEAVSGIDGLSQQEQEYLRHHLLGLWTIIDPEGHPVPGRRFSAALPEFREATTHLAAATDSLEVRSLAFCTEIESYGQIKKFPQARFKAGQQVILYCEIENFVASKVGEGYETHLQGSYDVFNEAGEKLASQLLPPDRQVSNNYLRDYFIAYQMHLPKELPAGTYRLQLTMEDLAAKKYGQAMLTFEVR